MITNHIIMPIGIIKKSTGAGTTIRLIPPHPSADKLQPQATILTRDSGTGAHARATVRVVETQGRSPFQHTSQGWPGCGQSQSGCLFLPVSANPSDRARSRLRKTAQWR